MAVILDHSGVISDDRRPVYESNVRILENHGLSRITFDEWLDKAQSNAPDFLRLMGIDKNHEDLLEIYKTEYTKCVKQGILPFAYPESVKAIKELFEIGQNIAVVSSHPKNNLHSELESYGLKKYISKIYSDSKNKANDIRSACSFLNSRPENSFYVGDTTFDIIAAKDAGVIAVAKLNGYHSKEKFASVNYDIMIEELTDLVPYLIF